MRVYAFGRTTDLSTRFNFNHVYRFVLRSRFGDAVTLCRGAKEKDVSMDDDDDIQTTTQRFPIDMYRSVGSCIQLAYYYVGWFDSMLGRSVEFDSN